MCWSSTKTTLLFTAVVCIGMNGFNLASRALGFRDKLLEDKTAAYIPDVNDLSKWVNGRKNSDNIIMGLAGVSLVFDIVLLGGALQERGGLIQISGLWGSFDCVVDAVIGFLSANYTMPSFQETKTADVPAKGRLRRRHRSKGHSYEMLQVMKAADEGEKKPTGKRTEETTLSIREPPPSAAKQALHFAWVILRLLVKSQILCSLFSYVAFLSQRDEMNRANAAKAAGGGGGATAMSTMDG